MVDVANDDLKQAKRANLVRVEASDPNPDPNRNPNLDPNPDPESIK